MDADQDETTETGAGRKHRRRGVAMVTSESFENLRPEWETLRRVLMAGRGTPGAEEFTALEAHPPAGADIVWLSIRVDDGLVGVVGLVVGVTGATVASAGDSVALVIIPGSEVALADGLLEWLWEDMTEALDLPTRSLAPSTLDAFEAAAERLGWGYGTVMGEDNREVVRFAQRR